MLMIFREAPVISGPSLPRAAPALHRHLGLLTPIATPRDCEGLGQPAASPELWLHGSSYSLCTPDAAAFSSGRLPKFPQHVHTRAWETEVRRGAPRLPGSRDAVLCCAEWVTLRAIPSGTPPPVPHTQGPEPVSRLPGGSADVALGSCLGPGSGADVTQPRGGGGSAGRAGRASGQGDCLLPRGPGCGSGARAQPLGRADPLPGLAPAPLCGY